MTAAATLGRVGEVAYGWKKLDSRVLEEAGVVSGERGSVLIPYRTLGGDVHNVRVFVPNGRCYWRTANLELIPFGLEQLPGTDARTTAIVLTEGESDCLAIREAFARVVDPGWPIRRYLAVGLPGAGTWRDEWRRYFARFSVIYVVGDGDAAGGRMMEAVRASLPWVRPVLLPVGEDARALLQRDGDRALDSYFEEADWTATLVVGFQVCRTLAEFETFVSSGRRP